MPLRLQTKLNWTFDGQKKCYFSFTENIEIQLCNPAFAQRKNAIHANKRNHKSLPCTSSNVLYVFEEKKNMLLINLNNSITLLMVSTLV